MLRSARFAAPLLLVLCACGKTASTSSGSGSGASGGSVGGDRQSPVPPDSECVTPAGAAVQLYSGDVGSFVVTDDFVYLVAQSNDGNVVRVSKTGNGAPKPFSLPGTPATSVAFGNGSILLGPPSGLVKIPVTDDTSTGPTYGASSAVNGGITFDGKSLFAPTLSEVTAGQTVLREMPIDGSPVISSNLPIHILIRGISAGLDGIYLAIETLPNAGDGAPFGSLIKVPFGGGQATFVVEKMPIPMGLAVDDSYAYIATSFVAGLLRVGLDGSGQTTLSSATVDNVAVDAHAIYFVADGQITRMDKATHATKQLAPVMQGTNGIVVHGGNVYWSVGSGGALSGPIMPGSITTTCK
jgi:hypothetical protein